MGRPRKTAEQFWAQIDTTAGVDACWPWLGRIRDDGYGVTSWQGVSRPTHQVALELDGRPLLPGEVSRHSCDFRRCCNPQHLLGGSHQDNMLDMVERGRAVKGADHGQAKLTEADVISIRSLKGIRPNTKVAKEFGISEAQVRHIHARRKWAHVEEAA